MALHKTLLFSALLALAWAQDEEPLTDEETAEFIAELDEDSDGIVRRDEYMRWIGEVEG